MTKFDKTNCIETTCNPIKEKYVSKYANRNIENVNKSKFNVGIHKKIAKTFLRKSVTE